MEKRYAEEQMAFPQPLAPLKVAVFFSSVPLMKTNLGLPSLSDSLHVTEFHVSAIFMRTLTHPS